MEPRERMLVFDYQVSRLVVGIIAFTLPFAVSFISWKPLPSISASYYTDARDVFVGMLFIVGSFFLAYNGHDIWQSRASKIASLAAILAALFPTKCDACKINAIALVHYCSATALFLILAYFCLGPFAKKAKNKNTKKSGRRRIIYQICGTIMIVCIVTVGISLAAEIGSEVRIIYWAEAVALVAFGTAWMTASRPIKFLAEEGERLALFKKELKVGS
jgi:uncharacterized Tic20 family protein